MVNSLVVFIKFYKKQQYLKNILLNLEDQTKKPNKIVIIDDGSPNLEVISTIKKLKKEFRERLNIQSLRMPLKEMHDLDTVGIGLLEAWKKEKHLYYDFISTIDLDTTLEPEYYEKIIQVFDDNPLLVCASGVLKIKTPFDEAGWSWKPEYMNIGSKVGRKDARGTGKVIRGSWLNEIPLNLFPEVDWDTWINTRAKVECRKAKQIDNVAMFSFKPTTRVVKKDLYRSGRLSYHFGYNPLLVLMKTVLAGRGSKQFLKGYRKARKNIWILRDTEVRKFFGWRFMFHPLR